MRVTRRSWTAPPESPTETRRLGSTASRLRTAAALVGALIAPLLVTQPATAAQPAGQNDNPAAFVNTFIGTLDEGNTFPGASAPFGMTQVSPTGSHFAGWEYDQTSIRGFGNSYLSGAGCWEQGGLLSMLPTTGTIGAGATFDTGRASSFDHKRYAATLSHDGEVGTAGYYRTKLTSYGGIDVETTASTRVGVQRYTFADGTPTGNVFLNTGQANETLKVKSSSVTVLNDTTVVSEVRVQGFCTGKDYEYTTWFATEFDRPFDSYGTWNSSAGFPGVASQDAGAGLKGAWATFDTSSNQSVQASTGMSFTSAAGALANLAAEGLTSDGDPIPFDDVRAATTEQWNAELGKATTYGGTADDNTSFYTSLYHAFLQPVTSSDTNGDYRGFDDAIHNAADWTYYQFFSLWDTYRSQNQLLAILQPERATDIGRSILTIQQQGGWLPRWAYANYEGNVMTGDPASPFLADLWRYGRIPGGVSLDGADTRSGESVELDENLALAALLQNVDSEPPADSQFAGRSGISSYLQNGYIAQDPRAPKKGMDEDRQHAGSATMEYAVGDCAVSLVADGIGDSEDASRLAARAANWKNVWDPALTDQNFAGFPRSRAADGTWSNETATTAQTGFQEGTPWQYQWLAWQDADGLAETMGGTDQALARLDTFFDIPAVFADPAEAAHNSWVVGTLEYNGRREYNPNNEPNLHSAWLYNFYGEPAKTSAVNRAAQTLFTNKPDGVTGNDDLGTMSAWYVFSAIGLYPSVAGTGDLLLHAPRFPRVDLSLGDTTLTITAPVADGETLQYIDSASLNGVPQTASVINWDTLKSGGELAVTLTDDATTRWATATGDRPAAPCSSAVDVTPPAVAISTTPDTPISGWHRGTVTVSVSATDAKDPAPTIEVRVDGGDWSVYPGAVEVTGDGSHTVEARATDAAGNGSEIAASTVKIDATAPVTAAAATTMSARTGESAAASTVRFTATDAGSGVGSTEYAVDGGDWLVATPAGASLTETGTHTVRFRSTDVAGNVETTRSLMVTVAAVVSPTAEPTTVPTNSNSPSYAPAAGGLASTGFEPLPWLLSATMIVLLGSALLRGRSRRRSSGGPTD
jgi:predicted alpha-1,2-mannosidase